MQTLRAIFIKTRSNTMAANLHKGVPAGAFPNKFNACSFYYTTGCVPCLRLLNCKRMLQWYVVLILQWYIVTYATRSVNTGTFTRFFKIFKSYLKATSFRRWNETLFQKFCDTYCLSKILFKNMSISTYFELCAF